MEINLGVIRDKAEIYSALMQRKSMNQQLAVCFNSEGKMLVKICTVTEIVNRDDIVSVVLKSQSSELNSEIVVPLENIQSLYPIRNFLP